MILQSLVRYYEILAADPACTIARPGWCSVSVSFAAVLSPDGTLLDFVSLKIQQPRGKNLVEVPQNLIVPEQAKRSSGIFPNFLCENPSYMFGIDGKGNPQRSLKCFQAFKTLHEEILAEIDVPEAKARNE